LKDSQSASTIRSLPDKVCVRNLDDSFSKEKVDGAGHVHHRAVYRVERRLRDGLGCGERVDNGLDDGTRKGAQSVAAIKHDGLSGGLGEDGNLLAVLDKGEAVEIDPVSLDIRYDSKTIRGALTEYIRQESRRQE
jgi:hypothetical protein